MDITSLYYFTEVAKDLHITKTANRLYISQQTLSNHIQRLEEYFGAPLLYRKPRLSLTYAGEFVLDYARQVMKEETNLKDILSDVAHMERGVIRFGASPLRAMVLSNIMPRFSSSFPNVEIRLVNSISTNLAPMVSRGDLDFAIINHVEDDPNLLSDRLISDQVYFCVKDSLLEKYYGEEVAEIKARSVNGAHVRDFERIPVCLFDNFLGQKIHRCFEDERVTPRCYMTTSYTQISTTIGLQGLAAFFATRVNLLSRPDGIPAGINIFPLLHEDKPVFLDVFVVRNRQRYMTHYSKYFMELLLKYYDDVEKARLEAGS